MIAYLTAVDLNKHTGYMYTYGVMSGAWYGGENAKKIELKNTLKVNVSGFVTEGMIGVSHRAPLTPETHTYTSTQTSSGTNTQVHRVNVNENVFTNLEFDGSWLDWAKQQVVATFTIPNVITKYASTSIVSFVKSI